MLAFSFDGMYHCHWTNLKRNQVSNELQRSADDKDNANNEDGFLSTPYLYHWRREKASRQAACLKSYDDGAGERIYLALWNPLKVERSPKGWE